MNAFIVLYKTLHSWVPLALLGRDGPERNRTNIWSLHGVLSIDRQRDREALLTWPTADHLAHRWPYPQGPGSSRGHPRPSGPPVPLASFPLDNGAVFYSTCGPKTDIGPLKHSNGIHWKACPKVILWLGWFKTPRTLGSSSTAMWEPVLASRPAVLDPPGRVLQAWTWNQAPVSASDSFALIQSWGHSGKKTWSPCFGSLK